MSPTVLSKILGADLQACREENPARCALADQAGQYVLDEDQQIIALNLFGYDGEDGRPALPPPADWLPDLLHLKYLNLARCGLKKLDLTAQTDLVVLFAQENKALAQLQLPAAFPALLRADLSHCALARVVWPESPVLEFLNVSRQEDKSLTDWSFAAACPRLFFCDLSHNGLTRFQLGAGFTNLGVLCLEDNALTEVEFGGVLPGLESLRLGENKLTTVKSEWLERAPNLLNLFLEKNEIEARYQTFIEGKSPNEALISLRDVFLNEALGTEKDDECKVMLIGNGEAGKSTIVYRLEHGAFVDDYDCTHGIELLPYTSKNWKLLFWDFGGQDIYHATHRLFMQSNVVYVLVWQPKTEPDVTPFQKITQDGETRSYRNYGIPYWMYYANVLGQDSPVILLQTHKEKEGVVANPYPAEVLQVPPPAYVHQIESSWDDPEENGYEDLLRYIDRSVKKVKAQQGEIATNVLEMRDWMRKQQDRGIKILSLEKYLARAEELGIQGAKDVLTSWLHKTGVVFYTERMADKIILDQEWAIGAIYTLFDFRQPHHDYICSKGAVVSGVMLNDIWKDVPGANPEVFVEFMLACDVCFELLIETDKPFPYREFLAPRLLPERRPDFYGRLWAEEPHWEVHYRYTFLHYGLIQRFLVQTRDWAELTRMYQLGTSLIDHAQRVTVEADTNTLTIRFSEHSFRLYEAVREFVDELQDEKPTVWVRARESDDLVPWYRIEACIEHGNALVETEVQGRMIPVDQFAPFYLVSHGLEVEGDSYKHSKSHSKDMKERIQNMIAQNRTDEALKLLKEAISERDQNAVLQVMSRLAKLNKSEMMGIISRSEYNLESNKISNTILNMASALGDGSVTDEGAGFTTKPVTKVEPRPTPSVADRATILFASANPTHTAKLKLDTEYRELGRHLEEQSKYRLRSISQMNTDEFIDSVFEQRPTIVHFAGHGESANPELVKMATELGLNLDKAGLVFFDADKRDKIAISASILHDVFESFLQDNVPLTTVIFNACYSEKEAIAVSKLGLWVIGCENEIADRAAIAFASGFYRVIGKGQSVEAAIRRGRTKARAAGLKHMNAIKVFKNGKEITT